VDSGLIDKFENQNIKGFKPCAHKMPYLPTGAGAHPVSLDH
jgi:hypothetical protein